jgi:hypothetical protein
MGAGPVVGICQVTHRGTAAGTPPLRTYAKGAEALRKPTKGATQNCHRQGMDEIKMAGAKSLPLQSASVFAEHQRPDTRRNIEAGLGLHTQGLQDNATARAADQGVGANAITHRRRRADAAVRASKRGGGLAAGARTAHAIAVLPVLPRSRPKRSIRPRYNSSRPGRWNRQ